MPKIPLIKPDLPRLEELEEAFREILENGRITNFGKYVTEFEKEAGEYLGAQAVSVSSGTMGLIFALRALGLRPAEKVILPSLTFMATAQAVVYAGGIPVFAEVGEDLTLSATDLKGLLQKHSDAALVLPVHLYGMPCQTHQLEEVVEEASLKYGRKIPILYDAAHAFGAAREGKKVGGFGNAEVFSLSVTKALVAVEGGLVTSCDQDVIERIRIMRNYGMVPFSYNASLPGLNGKMSEFHALIGLYNLKRLNEILSTRKKKAAYYARLIEEKTPFRMIPLPEGVVHTFKDFTLILPEAFKEKRGALMEFLKEKGIETRAYFDPPVHKQKFFSKFADRPLPFTEEMARRVLTLPFFTSITESEMDYVAHALWEAMKGKIAYTSHSR